MSPGTNIPAFGIKTSGPAKREAIGKGSKHFVSGSLGVIVSGATTVSTPGFLDP